METATLLREIADSLEGKNNGVSPAALYPVECFRIKSLEIEIKQKGDELYQIKARSKSLPTSESREKSASSKPEPDEKPKYKKLKKQMKQEFRQIHEALALNTLPEETLTDSFIKHSEMMVSYKSHGETYYTPYLSACRRFFEAIESQDLLTAKAIYQELNQIKADCHRKYK